MKPVNFSPFHTSHTPVSEVVGPLKNEVDQGGRVIPFAILQCLIQPNTEVRWLFEGENVENSSMFSMRVRVTTGNIFTKGAYGTTLTIHSLSYLDAGIYSCQVYNRSSAEWISAPIELVLPGIASYITWSIVSV